MRELAVEFYPCAYAALTLIYLVAPSIVNGQLADIGNKKGILLDSPNFRIQSKIRIIPKTTDVESYVQINERYSNLQRRARLECDTQELSILQDIPSRSKFYDYFLDSPANSVAPRLIKLNHIRYGLTDCENSDVSKLLADMFGPSSATEPEFSVDAWTNSWNNFIPDHIMGPARLLLVVKANQDKMRELKETGITIRNHAVRRYKMELNLNSPKSSNNAITKLTLYYGISSVHWPNAEFPLRIWAVLPSGVDFTIEYSFLEPVYKTDFMRPGDASDIFSFPIGHSCSAYLPPVASDQSKIKIPKTFSFKTEIQEHVFNQYPRLFSRNFIAYDGYMQTLRVEHIKTLDSSSITETSLTIFDLKRNLKFNIMTGEPPSCAIAQVVNNEEHKNPFEPVIPFDKLVFMGTGEVRGVDVLMFEHTTEELPTILFRAVNYKDYTGTLQSLFKPKPRKLWTPKSTLFTIVYYFASPSDSMSYDEKFNEDGLILGPLLRIDASIDNYIQYRAEIYEFLWHLAASPSGDRPDDLFSLNDKCSDTSQIADLRFELEFQPDSNQSDPMIEFVTTAELIKDPMARNQALLRAISGGNSKVCPTYLFDIESRLKMNQKEQKLTIFSDVKLNIEDKMQLFRAESLGMGMTRDSSYRVAATSFEDCFWYSLHKRKKGPVLFSYCLGVCVVDTKPTTGASVKDISSDAFLISPTNDLPCEILSLNPIPETSASRSTNLDSLYANLHGTKVILPTDAGISSNNKIPDRTDLSFTVKEVQLNGDILVGGITSKDKIKSNQREEFKGLGLFTGPLTRKVVPNTPVIQNDDDSIGRVVDYSFCHSKCISNMTCNSFSVCVTVDQVECLVSTIDLRDSELKDKISAQIKDAAGKGSISVELIDSDSGSKTVQLKVDRRCKIYTKRALEMFKLPKDGEFNMLAKNLIPVENAEKCAELCLGRSVKSFKRLAAKKYGIMKSSAGTNADEQMILLRDYMTQNMRYFCAKFLYLPVATTEIPEKTMKSLEKYDLLKSNGVCLVVRPAEIQTNKTSSNTSTNQPNDATKESVSQDKLKLRMESYEFVYSMLYEKKVNVALLPGSVEINVGQVVSNEQMISEQSDIEVCARSCFLQTIGLNPLCKSFTFVSDRSELMKGLTRRARTYCIFNSMSLGDVNRVGKNDVLIQRGSQEEITVWHYEPLESYSFDNAVWSKLINPKAKSNSELRLYGLGIFMTVVLGVTSGLIMGILVALKVTSGQIVRRGSIISQSESIMKYDITNTNSSYELDANVNELNRQ